MGDRVLFQVIKAAEDSVEFSPVIYGHNAGDAAPTIVAQLAIQMRDRMGDVSYWAARLVEVLCQTDPGGCLSIGIWNADAILTAKDSHGDAGVVLINADNGAAMYLGGYYNADGREVE
jgi:hypothetical protein